MLQYQILIPNPNLNKSRGRNASSDDWSPAKADLPWCPNGCQLETTSACLFVRIQTGTVLSLTNIVRASTSPDLPSFVELDLDGDSTAEGSLNNKVLQVEFAITL